MMGGGKNTLKQPQPSGMPHRKAKAATQARAKSQAQADLRRMEPITVIATHTAASPADPLRLVGIASLSGGAVYLVLWALGLMMSNTSTSDMDRFNAGRPVMLCTKGQYNAVDNSLVGRVFGDRYFACQDWKMGP